jgi:hypothetical protein
VRHVKPVCFITFFIFFIQLFFSQKKEDEWDYTGEQKLKLDDRVYVKNIRTVQLHGSDWELSPPVLELGSSNELTLSFDELDATRKNYVIHFVHCNADWTKSDLMETEYLFSILCQHSSELYSLFRFVSCIRSKIQNQRKLCGLCNGAGTARQAGSVTTFFCMSAVGSRYGIGSSGISERIGTTVGNAGKYIPSSAYQPG